MPNTKETVDRILTEAEQIQDAQGRIEVVENSNRRRLTIVAVGLALDILLTCGFFWLYFHQRRNTQSIHNACVADNRASTANRQVWQFVLDQSKGTDPVTINAFRNLIDQAYPIKDCKG